MAYDAAEIAAVRNAAGMSRLLRGVAHNTAGMPALATLAETATLMQRTLVGQDQYAALEAAEAIETAARQLHAMQLLAARAGFPWALLTDLREAHGADAAAGRRSRQAVAERGRNEGA